MRLVEGVRQLWSAAGRLPLTGEAGRATARRLAAMADAVDAAVEAQPVEAIGAELAEVSGDRWRYLTLQDGRMLLLQVAPELAETELEPLGPAIADVRRTVARLQQAHPDIEVGVTGLPVIEADETVVTQRDATLATLLAVVLIAGMMVLSFHSFIQPLLVVAALFVGVGWSFGFLTLAVGHLQLLSVTFTVILLGLGVDFGIHLVSRFELVRDRYPAGVPGFRATMIDTMQTMGPGIVTGAVTTSLAFGATLLTDFRGMAEMGLIAGVGIILCLIAMFAVLPALMRLVRPRRRHVKPVEHRPINIYEHHWWEPFYRRPLVTLAIVGVMAAAGGYAMQYVRYDYNLSNLLPANVESVQWLERLTEPVAAAAGDDGRANGGARTGEQSVWSAVSLVKVDDDREAALAEVRRRAEAFAALPTVAGVEGVGVLFPPDQAHRRARIAEARRQMGGLLRPPLPPARRVEPAALAASLRQAGAGLQAFAGGPAAQSPQPAGAAALAAQGARLKRLGERLGELAEADPARAEAVSVRLNRAFADWRSALRQQIDQALRVEPIDVADLPDVLARQAVADVAGREVFRLRIVPAADVYNPEALAEFVEQLRQVDRRLNVPGDERITGGVVQIYESTRLMVRAYKRAGLYALIAVLLIVLLDFQRIGDALLTLVPVGLAFVMLMGIMGANNLPINPANIIVLPLLFGIGVDCGVHIIHRYRQSPHEPPPGLAEGTGKGVTMTSITTIIGFACLMIAQHRGIFSLGFTLALGMALTLLACLTVMPAVLVFRHRLIGRPQANEA